MEKQKLTQPKPKKVKKEQKMFDKLFGMLSSDIAIDLGTANTLVYKQGQELSSMSRPLWLYHQMAKDIIIGKQAKEMLGKNPDEVRVVKPMKDGVIADFQVN
jgi:rod shape-determining protein MreB